MPAPESAIELLQSLIRIPSVNPEGDPGTTQTGEARIAEWLAAWLRETFPTARVELRPVLPDRPNVVACLHPAPGKPRLLFAPHTDTVSVGGMTIDPFAADLRENRIWGRGASDTKGSMAAMLWALRENRDRLAGLDHEIWFAGLCGEEAGQPGAKALASEETFAFVIAGEPTRLDAVIAHKGALWLTLNTAGRAVHAAEPERGDNALYKMADLLRMIRDDLAPALTERGSHPLLGHTTISAGIISGGSKVNIVPDHCRAELDIRYLPGADPLPFIEARLRATCPSVTITHTRSQPMLTDAAHPFIRTLCALGSQCVGSPWFSDAGVFAQRGMAAIALGPGSIAQAHTRDEWISVADFLAGVTYFERLLQRLATPH